MAFPRLHSSVAMTDVADASAAAPQTESVRDDLVERLKRENAELMESVARANARAGVFEEKERSRVAAFQPEAQYFMKEFMKEEIDAYHQGTSCLLYTSPSPRDRTRARMPSSA